MNESKIRSGWLPPRPLLERPLNPPPYLLLILPYTLLTISLLIPAPYGLTHADKQRRASKPNPITLRPSALNYRTSLFLPLILCVDAIILLGFGAPSTLDYISSPTLKRLLLPYFQGWSTGEPALDQMIGYLTFANALRTFDYLYVIRIPDLVYNRMGCYASHTPEGGWWNKLSWTASLVFSIRGIGWDWGQGGHFVPPPQERVVADRRNRMLFLRRLRRWACYYILIDLSSVWLQSRPYITSRTLAPGYHHLNSEPNMLRWMADVVACAIYVVGMEFQYLNLLLSVFLISQFLAYIGRQFDIPNLEHTAPEYDPEEAWPNLFGNPTDAYSIRRLFGKTWHQMMRRHVLLVPSPFIDSLQSRLSLSGKTTLALRQLAAFVVSGMFHAAGGWTLCNEGFWQFAWFSFLGLGAVVEAFVESTFRRVASETFVERSLGGKGRRAVWWVRCVGYVWTVFWLGINLNWLADENVRGGVFRREPVPVSIFRPLVGKWLD